MCYLSVGLDGHKGEVEDMIWEVDEDCDGAVDWNEFQAMYHRCRSDRVGREPRRLFNLTEFVMNDKSFSGRVSLEEAMQILYLRYGRDLMDAQLEDIFGTSDLNSGKTLRLTEFLDSLHANQVRQCLLDVEKRRCVLSEGAATAQPFDFEDSLKR